MRILKPWKHPRPLTHIALSYGKFWSTGAMFYRLLYTTFHLTASSSTPSRRDAGRDGRGRFWWVGHVSTIERGMLQPRPPHIALHPALE